MLDLFVMAKYTYLLTYLLTNVTSHKEICCGNKTKFVTLKRRLMLTKYDQCCTKKQYVFIKNGSCCI